MDETVPKKPLSRFQKGVSGNPQGGRVKSPEYREMEELARSYSRQAIQKIVDIMRGKKPKMALAAAKLLLERGYGMPRQQTKIEVGPNQQLLKLIEDGLARAAVEVQAVPVATLEDKTADVSDDD